MVRAIAQDPGVDAVVVGLDPLSPCIQSLPEGVRKGESLTSKTGIVTLMARAVAEIEKPVLGVVDAGRRFDPMVDLLEQGGVPVFRSSDRAVSALAKYMGVQALYPKIILIWTYFCAEWPLVPVVLVHNHMGQESFEPAPAICIYSACNF